MRARLALLLTLAVMTGLLAVPASATSTDAAPPFDYIGQADHLSPVAYTADDLETVHYTVLGEDGVEIAVEVVKPAGVDNLPVILETSVYHGTLHGRTGTRVFPDPLDANGDQLGLTGYFAPRGYAVAMSDLRGTGHSGGCLDHLGQNDLEDTRRVIEFLADAEWSNGRVGMTGHSYVGATQVMAAASDAEGLVTIVPSAGLGSMYDHQFQMGVPYLLQYAGTTIGYVPLSIQRHYPAGIGGPLGGSSGDDFGNNVQYTGCGVTQASVFAGSGQVTGQYELWHAERDHREAARDSEVAVFMVHGVNDNAARIPAAEWFFGGRYDRPQDKVWLGQWDHGSGGNTRCGEAYSYGHPNCRFDQWQYALHAWFDHHLMQRPGVETGPAVEVFLNDQFARETNEPGEVYTAESWSRPATTDLFIDTASGTLGTERPTTDNSQSFRLANASALVNAGGEGAVYRMAVAEDMLLVGLPTLTLYASLTTSQVQHLVIEVARIDATQGEEPVAYCAIQPSLRHGVETLAPVVPGEVMKLSPQCFTMAAELFAGDQLVMTVGSYSPHHVNASAEAQVTLYSGPGYPSRLRAPIQTDYITFPDVDRFVVPR